MSSRLRSSLTTAAARWLGQPGIFSAVVGRLALICSVALAGGTNAADGELDFVTDIRPILERHCYACHAADKQKSGLRLDVKAAAFKGGDGYGPSIIAGDAAESPLLQLVLPEADDLRMPLDGEPLTAAEIETLRTWIEQGAVWPDGVDTAVLEDWTDHWSFKRLDSRGRPAGIDEFVSEKLAEHDLQLSPPASRRDWLRRVYLDLHGLLPDADIARTFEQGEAPEDFVRVVDDLLNSPRYGERFAQHWLDVVRYADTDGFEVNTQRPNAWPYRDYVIEAFNRDTPYVQFIREQLAGDAFGVEAATGFLVTAAALLPGQIGQDDASKRLARQDELAEIVINTGEAFLALSVGCARCHDHKFDAISQRDYYSMVAFYSGVRYGERPRSQAEWRAAQSEVSDLKQELAELQRELERHGLETQQTAAESNELVFERRLAKFVRFEIYDANRHPTLGLIEPCIDEFEIFDSSGKNVALATHGTQVTASGSRSSGNHQLEFVNDGRYGNSFSWMSDEAGRGWLLFELPEESELERVVWSRDREGQFSDRLPTLISLETGSTLESLQLVAGPSQHQLQAYRELDQRKRSLQQALDKASSVPMVFAGEFVEPEACFRLLRGDPEQPLEPVTPAVLSSLGELVLPGDAPDQQRRLALADWIASPDNPLTARVMVNRLWQWHFGIGLVSTPSDFGRQGERPSHPELLDWLAAEFIRSGWSVKHMQRLIVLSATYRQQSKLGPQALAIDADTRLLWRYPARRIDAETLRDTMLQVSGRLHYTSGGPGFDLFKSRGGLSGFPPIESFDESGLRRMVYAHKVRMERDAVFGAFDCPDAGQSLPRRSQSTTPTQALNLFNSRFTLDAAEGLAARVEREVDHGPPAPAEGRTAKKITHAYQLVLGRSPEDDELSAIAPLVDEYGLVTLCRALLNSNEFLFMP
jgi:hypothetical protein